MTVNSITDHFIAHILRPLITEKEGQVLEEQEYAMYKYGSLDPSFKDCVEDLENCSTNSRVMYFDVPRVNK